MKKILLVEDDKNIVELVEYILAEYGFKVRSHVTGLNVPEVVTEYNPDLILLDIRLPGKTGTEICKELKQTFDIPVILFSAEPDHKRLVKEYNADSFLEKPFDITELITSVSLLAN